MRVIDRTEIIIEWLRRFHTAAVVLRRT